MVKCLTIGLLLFCRLFRDDLDNKSVAVFRGCNVDLLIGLFTRDTPGSEVLTIVELDVVLVLTDVGFRPLTNLRAGERGFPVDLDLDGLAL